MQTPNAVAFGGKQGMNYNNLCYRSKKYFRNALENTKQLTLAKKQCFIRLVNNEKRPIRFPLYYKQHRRCCLLNPIFVHLAFS